MFRKKHQQYTRDEFIRFFAIRVVNESITGTVYDYVRQVTRTRFIAPFEDLHQDHGIAEDDLDELVQSILDSLGLRSDSSDHLQDRPAVRTIDGLVMLIDFAYRLERPV